VSELVIVPLVPGLDLLLRVDGLGLVFGLLASLLWIVTGVYSGGYARATALGTGRRYFASFAASIGAAMGVAFAGNLLTFFLFYEALTLATYPLVVHNESEEAFAAGRRYLLFSLGGGLALLTATSGPGRWWARWTSRRAASWSRRLAGRWPSSSSCSWGAWP
jgi:multicomponent Na+:H+ antiporter subunit D